MKKFKRRRVYAGFKDTIWEADLAEIGSLCSTYRDIKYLSLPFKFRGINYSIFSPNMLGLNH